VAELELSLYNSFTSEFIKREHNSRDLFGKHWQDKTVPDSAKRCLLQSMGYQFPCAKLLKLWCIREDDDCSLCKRLHPDVAPWPEILGHIEPRCPVLRNPRIAVHHGIWCDLLTSIRRNSLEAHDDGEKKWHLPSAVSEATHNEGTVRQILVHLGLFSGIVWLEEEVATFHVRRSIFLTATEITIFQGGRPDAVAVTS